MGGGAGGGGGSGGDLGWPPSTGRLDRPAPRSSVADLASSATDAASPSTTARMRCARVTARFRPRKAPRADGRQCGAPSPASAGTKITPALLVTLPAPQPTPAPPPPPPIPVS